MTEIQRLQDAAENFEPAINNSGEVSLTIVFGVEWCVMRIGGCVVQAKGRTSDGEWYEFATDEDDWMFNDLPSLH